MNELLKAAEEALSILREYEDDITEGNGLAIVPIENLEQAIAAYKEAEPTSPRRLTEDVLQSAEYVIGCWQHAKDFSDGNLTPALEMLSTSLDKMEGMS